MKKSSLKFKRRIAGKTNYKKRYTLLVSGKSRAVIRITNKKIIAQIIRFNACGDETLVSSESGELKKFGWNHSIKSIPSAYLTGFLCAKKSSDKKISNIIPDLGLHTPTRRSRVFAVVKGLSDGGIKLSFDKEKTIDDSRTKGEHIAEYKKDKSILDDFEKVRKKIEG